MHSNREGIPILFQTGPYYSRQTEWGEMGAGFWGFRQVLTPPCCSRDCPTVASAPIGATCSRGECG